MRGIFWGCPYHCDRSSKEERRAVAPQMPEHYRSVTPTLERVELEALGYFLLCGGTISVDARTSIFSGCGLTGKPPVLGTGHHAGSIPVIPTILGEQVLLAGTLASEANGRG